VAGVGLAEDTAQVLDLGVAAHEAREAAEHRSVQPRSRRARPRQLEDLPLGQRQRLGRDDARAGIGELLHPCCQVRGLADPRVVHV
jgi:hypothetical protein